jgi:hypothetical protein
LKVGRGIRFPVFVIAWRRPGSILEFAPGGAIAALELSQISGIVDHIAQGKNRALDSLDQSRRGQSTARVSATDDVPGSDKDRSLRGGIGFHAPSGL